ncbi:MAG: VOC family protein [Bryobacterales bacterium]|nr:VOC family protein [Bryobacterales bacterium]
MAKPIPEGYHTITPYLVVKDANQAIDFYKRAFGARELSRMTGPDGQRVMHAEIKIGDSVMMLSDEFPGAGVSAPQSVGGTTCQTFLYVPDVDAAFKQAVSAGATANMPPSDMFWGDRFGKLSDPFGHHWGLATHKEDVAPEEMRKRAEAFFAQMAEQRKAGGGTA